MKREEMQKYIKEQIGLKLELCPCFTDSKGYVNFESNRAETENIIARLERLKPYGTIKDVQNNGVSRIAVFYQ